MKKFGKIVLIVLLIVVIVGSSGCLVVSFCIINPGHLSAFTTGVSSARPSHLRIS